MIDKVVREFKNSTIVHSAWVH